MPCYHPLHAFPYGIDSATGKRQLYIVRPGDKLYDHPDTLELPCGKCDGCRLDRSRQWANRCMLERKYCDSAYFVTLTYNEEQVPRSWYSDPATGEAFESLTLRKRDFQLFMKRLRKAFPDDKIRFFGAGEYGENTMRPHYHVILFGLHLNDLIPFKKDGQGHWLYRSPSLERVWSVRNCPNGEKCVTPLAYDPIGNVTVGDCTWESCAYTARYCMKKLNGEDAEYYQKFGLEPPFSLMSRKPGIGRQYYDDHPELFEYQFINVSTENGGRKVPPPRYYDRLLETDNPELLSQLKENRKEVALQQARAKELSTTLRREEYLEVEERQKKSAVRTLLRKGV